MNVISDTVYEHNAVAFKLYDVYRDRETATPERVIEIMGMFWLSIEERENEVRKLDFTTKTTFEKTGY